MMNSPETRILYVDHAPIIGGAEMSLLELLETLSPRYVPAVACPGVCPEFLEAMEPTRAKVFLTDMPRLRGPGAAIALACGVRNLRRAIRVFQPHIVHSNTVRAHIIGAIAARLCGVRTVWTIRDYTFPPRYYRLLAPLVDAVIFVSQHVRQSYVINSRPDRARVILNGVSPPTVDPPAERARIRSEHGIPDGVPLAVSVGQLIPWKGQDQFLRAAAVVKQRLPDARFMLVGDSRADTYKSALRNLADREPLRDSVTFTGFRRDPVSFMCASDLVVHTSVEPEAFGRTLVEAMAVGRPVIASPYGGPSEIIEHGVNGLLVPPERTDELAQAMTDLLSDPDTCARLSRAGLSAFSERFHQTRETRAIEEVYDSLPPSELSD